MSFPGLSSFYQNNLVFMHVKDILAEDVAGKIGMPTGADFKVVDDAVLTSKTRSWSWKYVDEIPEEDTKGPPSMSHEFSTAEGARSTPGGMVSKTGTMAAVDEGEEGQEKEEHDGDDK